MSDSSSNEITDSGVMIDTATSSDMEDLASDQDSLGSDHLKPRDQRMRWKRDSWREGHEDVHPKPMSTEKRLAKLEDAFRTILECVGEDPKRDGLLETPARAAKAILFLTKGYEENVDDVVKNAKFVEDYNSMVAVKDIGFYSLCEHHLIPFYGKIHIGYLPTGKVLGLSKLARISEMFTRRFQNQERIAKQIASAVVDAIRPSGVGVIVEGCHMCMSMRGVQKTGSTTITSTMLGTFLDDQKTRDEFLHICTKSS